MGKSMVAGIDVGGAKKGFHCAVLDPQNGRAVSLYHARTAEGLVGILRSHLSTTGQSFDAIAIDAPARATRKSKLTRSAERALSALGYRIFWTPRATGGSDAPEWMQHGAKLFQELSRAFPDTPLLETFPTAVTDRIHGQQVQLDLSLLHGKTARKHYPDFIDAIFAASSAMSFANGHHQSLGEDDEIGPVVLPHDHLKDHTLVLIVQNGRILLGKKKRGFGAGYYNGFGGKREPGESLLEAARRELKEEALIDCPDLEPAGRLNFTFGGQSKAIRGYVFRGSTITGTPEETEEMAPEWFALDAIPYDQMWADDPLWFPLFLKEEPFDGYFHFDASGDLSHWRIVT